MKQSGLRYPRSLARRSDYKVPLRLALVCALFGLFAPTADAACSVKSDASRAALVELYTSEGCSDCPPADIWLSRFKRAPASAARIVPLAYHVDYWDDLGWPDRFAQARFGERQHATVRLQHGRTVFTPQIVVNGQTLLQWAEDKAFADRVDATAKLPAGADIELSAEAQPERSWHVQATVSRANGDAVLYFALLENDLVSAVARGENRGKALHHDFVVRQFAGPFPVGSGSRATHHATLDIPADAKRKNLGLVAFVQHPEHGQTLQAVSIQDCLGD